MTESSKEHTLKPTNVDIMPDASEVVHYNVEGIPLYIKFGKLSYYTQMRAICHWHQDFEFMQILQEDMNYFVGGRRVPLHEGDCLFVNSRQMHYGYDAGKKDCTFVCTLIEPSLLTASSALYKKYVAPLSEDTAFPYYVWTKEDDDYEMIFALLSRVYEMKQSGKFGYEMEAVSAMEQLFSFLLKAWHAQTPAAEAQVSDAQLDLQRRMVAFIAQNYRDDLTLDQIAASASVSKSTCCRLFKRYLSQSPFEFLHAYRLEVSCNLLQETDRSISDIAGECGFNHTSYFIQLFQRRYGCTPSVWRRNEKPA